jgi:hypothetical protein
MKKFVFLFIGLFTTIVTVSQTDEPCESCLPEGITFTTQSQIDSFQINYPNCREIEGFVSVHGYEITNLNGLNDITSVGGDLGISGCLALQDLSGLENISKIHGSLIIGKTSHFNFGNPVLVNVMGLSGLKYIGGDFILMDNGALTDLSGLNKLDTIEGSLCLGGYNLAFTYGNIALTSISALSGLDYVGGSIMILGNHALTSLTGLENLTRVNGELDVIHCHQLSDLTGLDNITTIGGSLGIADNNSLTSLNGLENLDTIIRNLSIGMHQYWTWFDTIWGNNALTDLTALENLDYVGFYVDIKGNAILTSLDGLGNVGADSIYRIRIHNNPLLSTCEVSSICNYLTNPVVTPEIHDNAPGCNSIQEVEEACESVSVTEFSHCGRVILFPNPAQSTLTIQTDKKTITEIKIYNLTGQLVLKERPSGNKVDVTGLNDGLYVIECMVEDRWYRQMLVVRK